MKLKRDKLFRRFEAHKQFMTSSERATHKRKRDARRKKEKRRLSAGFDASMRSALVGHPAMQKAEIDMHMHGTGAVRVLPDGNIDAVDVVRASLATPRYTVPISADEAAQLKQASAALNFQQLAPVVDPEDLTLPLPAETMAEVSEGKLK